MSAPAHRSSLLHRLTALLGVALVLALNVLAVRPDLHAALHAAESAGSPAHPGGACSHSHGQQPTAPVTSEDHDCVISAFAHGHADLGATPLVLPAIALTQVATLTARVALAPQAAAFLLPPVCGPPLA